MMSLALSSVANHFQPTQCDKSNRNYDGWQHKTFNFLAQ